MNISDFPLKLYYSIGDVSQIAQVEPHVLRYWETEFKSISPSKGDSGRRMYRKKDVENILLIKHLLYEKKFTIAGAKKYFAEMRRKSDDLFDEPLDPSPAPAQVPAEAPAELTAQPPQAAPAPQQQPPPPQDTEALRQLQAGLQALRDRVRQHLSEYADPQ